MSYSKHLFANNYRLLDRASQVCKKGVFIDAGANVGGMICMAHDMEVHAFEPVDDVFNKMLATHGKRPNTYFINCGLSDKEETLEGVTVVNCWTLGKPEETGYGVVPEYKGRVFNIPLTTLDGYCEANGLTVGVMKVDVDGYEHRLLVGAKNTILRDRPFINIEISCMIAKISGDPYGMIDFVLDDLKYTFVSNDGRFSTKDRVKVMECWPHHSSYDLTLCPDEALDFWITKP